MNQSQLQENKMGVMPVGKLLFNMALPMIIAMLVQALYNVVDTVYVSRISESAVTALSLAFPIQNLQIAFAVGTGVGVNALLSKSLGENNQETANRAAGNGATLMLIVVACFMLFGIFGSRPYFEMQSQVRETVEGGITYTTICCVFTLGIFIEILGERLLQATGRTVFTLLSQGTGALTNILLDPVFIFGVDWLGIPAMGITGAAVATVIGQWLAMILVTWFNLRHNPEIQLAFRYLKPDKEVVKSILVVGIPTIVMNSISSVMAFGLNQILQNFKETATSVLGVYFKLQSFFFMPVFGINNASISIIAYNYGARKPDRIMKSLKTAGGAALTVMTIGCLSFLIVPELLMGMFNPSEEFLTMGCRALRIIGLCFPPAAIAIVLGASFQAMGNAIYSTIVSMCRQLVVLLPVAYLLSLTGNVNFVWWAFPVSEIAGLVMSAVFFYKIYKNKISPLYDR